MAGTKHSERPFRIYDANGMRDLPWRAYVTPTKAIEKCLVLLYQLKTGNTYTVYNANSSTAILEVRRSSTGLQFMEDKPGTLQRIIESNRRGT